MARKKRWERLGRKTVQRQQRDDDQADRIEQLERELAAAQDESNAMCREMNGLRAERDELREELASRLDELEAAGVEVGETCLYAS